MNWHKHATFNYVTNKLTYKGIYIGITPEMIQDIKHNSGLDINDDIIEDIYNKHISIIRDKKIDEVLTKS